MSGVEMKTTSKQVKIKRLYINTRTNQPEEKIQQNVS